MKTFDFSISTKVTCWYETPFSIEADTIEEARQKAIAFLDEAKDEYPCEILFETIEEMYPNENDGQPTIELQDSSTLEIIWDNVKS